MSGSAFMSYSRDDSAFALRLAQDLKLAGAQVWLDQIDIKAGTSWDNAIEEALSEATHLLIVLSPASSRSNNVRNEISYAMEQGKVVIPVLYTDCNVPLQLQRTQRIDFRADYDRSLHSLVTQLQNPLPVFVPKPVDNYVQGQPQSHPAQPANVTAPPPVLHPLTQTLHADAPPPHITSRHLPWILISLVGFVVTAAAAGAALWIHHDNSPAVLYQQALIDSSNPKFYPQAGNLFERACRAGHAKSCTALAVLYQTGKLDAPDTHPDEPLHSFSAGCNDGDAQACGALGKLYYDGDVVTKNADLAFSYDQKACQAHDFAGCAQLGILYALGEGVARDPKAAIDNFKLACDGNDPIGCSALGKHYAAGDGVPKNAKKAVELDQKACDAGHPSSCTRLGDLYRTGEGVTQNGDIAKQYYQKGCVNGDGKACDAWLPPPTDTTKP